MYIKYIWFGLVRFYGMSTIVGYLMPNPLYAYILVIWAEFSLKETGNSHETGSNKHGQCCNHTFLCLGSKILY